MKKTLLLIITMACFIYSCNDDWLEIKPKGQASLETFSSKKGVNALLIGTYAVIDGTHKRSGDTWASAVSNWVWGSVASDDAYKGSSYGDQSTINPVEGFYVDTDNGYVDNHWEAYYDGIVRANDVLKVLPEVKDMTAKEKEEAEAQARFLRAHFYVELTLVHGKVPYIDEKTEDPGSISNDRLVWPEIEKDLEFAMENLPDSWGGDKGRASSWAAKTYLARAYMFQKKFDEAKPLLNDVYTNGGFTLVDSYEKNYEIASNNNSESIFEIQYAVNDGSNGSYNGGYGDALNFPHGGAPTGTCCGFFQPTHSLVSAFRVDKNTGLPLLDDSYSVDDILPSDPDINEDPVIQYPGTVDPRLDHTVGRPGIPYLDWGIMEGNEWIRDPANGGPYLYKKNMFKASEKGQQTATGWATGVNSNNFRKFRLGHVILWLAECEAEATDGNLKRASDLVNEIRLRAKNSNWVQLEDGSYAANYLVEPYPGEFPDKTYALKAIRHETRIEFAMEGMRFFDLVRWGLAEEVMNNYLEVEGTVMGHLKGKNFTAGQNEIWPIPQEQIDLSMKEGKSVLNQNNGY